MLDDELSLDVKYCSSPEACQVINDIQSRSLVITVSEGPASSLYHQAPPILGLRKLLFTPVTNCGRKTGIVQAEMKLLFPAPVIPITAITTSLSLMRLAKPPLVGYHQPSESFSIGRHAALIDSSTGSRRHFYIGCVSSEAQNESPKHDQDTDDDCQNNSVKGEAAGED